MCIEAEIASGGSLIRKGRFLPGHSRSHLSHRRCRAHDCLAARRRRWSLSTSKRKPDHRQKDQYALRDDTTIGWRHV